MQQGYWYGEQGMCHSPSWQPLQGQPSFERLAKICIAREAQARLETGAAVLLAEPEGGYRAGEAAPVFIALHGNSDNAARALEGWRPITNQGWLLAAVQSSQIVATRTYGWFDAEVGVRDVEEQYARLCERYAIDQERVIIAGFSMGGDIALRLALRGAIPARGFILLGPGGPAIDTPGAMLAQAPRRAGAGPRGYAMVGDEDAASESSAVSALVEALNANHAPCLLDRLPGPGHAYPPEIAPSLARALAFVMPGA